MRPHLDCVSSCFVNGHQLCKGNPERIERNVISTLRFVQANIIVVSIYPLSHNAVG